MRASNARTSPVSSPRKRTASAPATGAEKGTTGEREWATPASECGTQSVGQMPPPLPRVTAWTVRSFDMARMPYVLITGGTTAVAPVE